MTNSRFKRGSDPKNASRFRNSIGKYKVYRGPQCRNCAACVVSCPDGVHFKAGNAPGLPMIICASAPIPAQNPTILSPNAPQAPQVGLNPIMSSLGDYRWPAELLMSTWYQAETGELPDMDLEYRTGNSGGGFDKLRFRFPDTPPGYPCR